jgi:hypothetical protein
MFDLKDGLTDEMISSNVKKIKELISMSDPDQFFRAKYQNAIQQDTEAAGLQAQLQGLLAD